MQYITVRKILEFVDDRVESGQRTDIDSITAYSGYSRRHIQRLFCNVTGMNLGDYIRRRRLTRAALLLRLTRRTLTDIALSLGFDSQQSFCREFRKATGYSPLQYRLSPFWPLSVLMGRVVYRVEALSEPSVVQMSGGGISGPEVISRGCIPYSPDSGTVESFVDSIFSRVAADTRPLWVVTETEPDDTGEGDYQVRGGMGYAGESGDTRYTWREGLYFRVTFITSRERHMESTHHIYLNVLPEYGLNRAPGPDIMTFCRDGEKIMCTLFIPVTEDKPPENSDLIKRKK
ncbi:TPA_asm: helix-turn-helix domain-containing protein [Salmonella enterica subsp. enterica serovar Typhimurium str. SL1344]|uniref:Helix-turn-helix domain-containing protein n=1 Tax=Salmonella typhimurium (strain SL1344) TaxID=216597 RepID=A0A718Y4A9_SALTS|nr:helix-turn-helix domain-containing protein [Salmonella enterica subsp. enterica serovar Typhimurium str. SL1344]